MPGSTFESGPDRVKVSPPISFDAKSEGLAVPDGSKVSLVTYDDAGNPLEQFAMDDRGGGRFFYDGDLPSGKNSYRFYVKPPLARGSHDFLHPAGDKSCLEWDSDAATASTSVAPAAGPVPAHAPAAAPAAPTAAPTSPSSAPADTIKTDTMRSAMSVFEASQAATGKEGGKGAKEVYKLMHSFGEALANAAESPDATVKAMVSKGLHTDVAGLHDEWIAGRDDLTKGQKKILESDDGRFGFRRTIFNELCAKGALGLSIGDKITGPLKKEDADKYMRKQLGKHWGEFDNLVSAYDGGNVRRALSGMVDEVVSSAEGTAERSIFERMRYRKDGRSMLAARIAKRAEAETAETYGAAKESEGIMKFLKTDGADAALKFYGLSLILGGSPLIGVSLIAAKGILEASGISFGNLAAKTIGAPFRWAGMGLKKGLNLLSEDKKEKLPEFAQKWLKSPTPPSFNKVGRGELTSKERWMLFKKGFIPFPSIGGGPVMRGAWSGLKKTAVFGLWGARAGVAKLRKQPVPEKPKPKVLTADEKAKLAEKKRPEDFDIDAIMSKQSAEARGAIDSAVQAAFSKLETKPDKKHKHKKAPAHAAPPPAP